MSVRHGYVEYHDDYMKISGNVDGSPRMTGLLPSPDCNTQSEEEREQRHKDACDALYLQGYFIVSKRRIRNPTFDKPGQKTTLKVIYRPCKNEGEILQVKKEIQRILDEKRAVLKAQ